jgi:hypothetical protein
MSFNVPLILSYRRYLVSATESSTYVPYHTNTFTYLPKYHTSYEVDKIGKRRVVDILKLSFPVMVV